jgi:hypothetical protein
VEDFRKVNENTETDAHPLPRIEEMVQRQSEFKLWSSLDCKDGYHQMPLKEEHRHITCMSTPRGTYQWTVQVMGLKNAGAQFQRMMEWILRNHDHAAEFPGGGTSSALAQDVSAELNLIHEKVGLALVHNDAVFRQSCKNLSQVSLVVVPQFFLGRP